MQWIDDKYFPANGDIKEAESRLKAGIASSRKQLRAWENRSLNEQLRILYSIVDYWVDIFKLDSQASEELYEISGLVARKGQLIPTSYDLKLYPAGVVRLKDIPNADLLKVILVNWVAGNALVIDGAYSKEYVVSLALVQPFNGALQFVSNAVCEYVQIDLLLGEDQVKSIEPLHLIQKVSVLLHSYEWNCKEVNSQGGY